MPLNFVLQTPSLQHLAAVKIVAVLWNHQANLKRIEEISNVVMKVVAIKWEEIVETLTAQALALELTEPCKVRVVNLIEPLGMEIFRWCGYHYITGNDEHIFLKCSLPKQFYWSMLGTVDYAKTARLLVKDEWLDNEKRYEIACVNCLEDEARQLIQFITEERRREYINKVLDVNRIWYKQLIVFFTCTLIGDTDQLNVSLIRQVFARGVSINHYLFRRSLVSSNRATSDYFFNKLNHLEVNEGIFGDACLKFPTSNMLFYLSLMSNEEQQRRVFRQCIGVLLIYLLRWPMQSLFMEAAECGRRYMVYGDYEKVLGAVIRKISDDAQDYDYSQLFRECWSLTPTDVRRRLLDNAGFLDNLLETDRDEFIKLILNKAPAHQLLVLSNNFHEKCQVLLDESVISDAELVKCKEAAALKSSITKERNVEKRLRSEHLCQLMDIAIEERIKKRRIV